MQVKALAAALPVLVRTFTAAAAAAVRPESQQPQAAAGAEHGALTVKVDLELTQRAAHQQTVWVVPVVLESAVPTVAHQPLKLEAAVAEDAAQPEWQLAAQTHSLILVSLAVLQEAGLVSPVWRRLELVAAAQLFIRQLCHFLAPVKLASCRHL